ncbi:MAG: crosslink repair DNA glycosylase YcaQ family protein [Anaeromyxobacter sp.]
MDSLSRSEARRLALAAQGLDHRPDRRRVDVGTVAGVVRSLGLVQIDSIQRVARSHYLPIFSRLGPYERALLDRAASEAPRRIVESWAHVASFIPVELHPLLRWRGDDWEREAWTFSLRLAKKRPGFVEEVHALVAKHGPLTARELEKLVDGGARRGKKDWGWNWSDGKRALAVLFWSGRVVSAGRSTQFEQRYDLTERVVPPEHHPSAPPPRDEAIRALVERSARALGVATAGCLRDYFRLPLADLKAALPALEEAGVLVPVRVEGLAKPAWRHRDARLPRAATGRALLSPFDSLVFERKRTEAFFDFRFRLEVYTPAAKREHGYYVLPFLLGDRLVARVDLEADRAASRLRVHAAFLEPGAPKETAAELREALGELAAWLGLERVAVGRRAASALGR